MPEPARDHPAPTDAARHSVNWSVRLAAAAAGEPFPGDEDLGKIYPDALKALTDPIPHVTAALAALDPAERADAERLAAARHHLHQIDSSDGAVPPPWASLAKGQRAMATMNALPYLRAAREAGLIPADDR